MNCTSKMIMSSYKHHECFAISDIMYPWSNTLTTIPEHRYATALLYHPCYWRNIHHCRQAKSRWHFPTIGNTFFQTNHHWRDLYAKIMSTTKRESWTNVPSTFIVGRVLGMRSFVISLNRSVWRLQAAIASCLSRDIKTGLISFVPHNM